MTEPLLAHDPLPRISSVVLKSNSIEVMEEKDEKAKALLNYLETVTMIVVCEYGCGGGWV